MENKFVSRSGRRDLSSFARREDGAAAIVFGVVSLPLLFSIGAAVDYSKYTQAKTKLDEAADAGALAAARIAKRDISAGVSGWKSAAVTAGQKAFVAGVGPGGMSQVAAPSVSVENVGGNITATLAYQARVSTGLLSLLRIGSLSIANTVKASTGSATGAYYNVSLVLDVSPSMAIAGSAADMAKLQSLTAAPGCAFACHDAEPGQPNNYDIARANNITLRMDILKTAAQALTTAVTNATNLPGQFTMGVYGMSHKLRTYQAPTASMTAVSSAITTVDFDKMSEVVYTLPAPAPGIIASGVNTTHYGDTDFATSLNSLTTMIPANGAGVSSSPKQIVVLATDGVGNVAVPYNGAISATYAYPPMPAFSSGNDYGKMTGPIDPALCDGLKKNGATVAVLHVVYTPQPSDPIGAYQPLVQTNAPPDAVTANLKACATSTAFYYEATDLNGMTAGLASLFAKATQIGSIRVTQ